MNVITALLFLLSGLFGGQSLLPKQFYYTREVKDWREAQTYCREKYTDLAFVDSEDDLDKMKASLPSSVLYHNAWIGRFNLDSATQNITETDYITDYNTDCAVIDTSSWKQSKKNCKQSFPVYCSQDVGKRVLMRMKLKPDGQVDLNDPAIKAKILAKINENFNTIGFGDVIKIQWLKEQNRQAKISENNTCDG